MKTNQVAVTILSVVILFSSCKAYYKEQIEISEVSKENIRVRMITTDGRLHRFKRVKEVNGIYYGVVNHKKPEKNIRLFEKDILEIRKLSKKRSRLATITLISIVTGFIAYVIYCGIGCQRIQL